ncbi:hypothetical protein Tco_1537794 [Tanacetum coccineum]
MGEGTIAQTRSERVPTPSYDSPLLGGNTPRSDEERLEQHELTNNVPPTPHDSPLPGEGLESDLMKIKKLYATAFKELISRVKSLEDEEDFVAKDPSKQGRSLIVEMDLDAGIPLVPPHVEVQGRYGQNLETQEGFGNGQEVSTVAKFQLLVQKLLLLMQNLTLLVHLDVEVALKLQEEFDAAKRQRMAQVHQAAQVFTDAKWDDVLARVTADEDFVQQLQAGEKCSEEDLPMKHAELVNQRKKFFADNA